MKSAVKHFRQLSQRGMTVGRYLHGDAAEEHQARRYNDVVDRNKMTIKRRSRGRGEFNAEPRDPLEISLLSGDRDEYIDKSFWHDAEARGVTFDESRVDGIWEEDGNEMWK